jgi:hypothetical protein
VYSRPLDIHPVQDLFQLAPNRRFAEKSRGGKNTVDLDRRWIPHGIRIVIDNEIDTKWEIRSPASIASNSFVLREFSLDNTREIDYNKS